MRVPTNKMFQFMNVEQGMISASAISLKSFFCIGLDFEFWIGWHLYRGSLEPGVKSVGTAQNGIRYFSLGFATFRFTSLSCRIPIYVSLSPTENKVNGEQGLSWDVLC